MGNRYENDMFVADSNSGRIYHFDLNRNRTELTLKGALADNIADDETELKEVIFAQGFGPIADLEIGLDGYLYVLTNEESGSIYRISGH
jgi:glucose/arabinose dehydrogenase